MSAVPGRLLSLFRLWAVHLFFAVIAVFVAMIMYAVQSLFTAEAGVWTGLVLGTFLSLGYILTLANVARRNVRKGDAIVTGILAALPFALIIAAAVFYLNRVPHNTITYNFILLPVTFPFTSWMEWVFPALPFHILALFVPLAMLLSTIAGSLTKS